MAKRKSVQKKAAIGKKTTTALSRKPSNHSSKRRRSVYKTAPALHTELSQAVPQPAQRVPMVPVSGKAGGRGMYAQLLRDRRALRIASIILGIIAVLHFVRFVTGFTLIVDDVVLPIAASGFITIIFGVLAVWYYRLSLD